jgi:hypothetical protein
MVTGELKFSSAGMQVFMQYIAEPESPVMREQAGLCSFFEFAVQTDVCSLRHGKYRLLKRKLQEF